MKLLHYIALAAFALASVPDTASAQACSGVFASGAVCGNGGASSAPAGAVPYITLFQRNFGSTANAILGTNGSGTPALTTSLPSAVQLAIASFNSGTGASSSTFWRGDGTWATPTASPSGAAGGDLSGTYPNPTVAKINGTALGSMTPTSGNVPIGSGSQWVTKAISGDGTLSSTGALTVTKTNGTSFGPIATATKGYTTAIIYPADFGVIGDNSTSNNTPVQNLLNACSTFSAFGNACRASWPCGSIKISVGFTSTQGMVNDGCGPGAMHVLPGHTAQVGGTVFVQSCTTCITFQFTTLDPVVWMNIGFDAPLNATAGSILHIKAPAVVDGREQNLQSTISNVGFLGGYNQLTLELAANYSVFGSVFRSPANHGINLLNSVAFSDSGDAQIYSNTFWVLLGAPFAPFGGDCIHVETQSGLRIFSNKMLLCSNGINVVANQGGAGVLQGFDNNIEEYRFFAFRLAQGAPGQTYGQVTFHHNNIQSGSTYAASVIGGIGVLNGAAQYLSKLTFDTNNILIGGGVIGARCIFILDGDLVTASNNRCDMGGIANHGGISVGTNATNVALLDNQILNIAAGQPIYDTTVSTLVRDLYGVTFANYPPNAKTGSTVLVTDGRSTNIGAGDFSIRNGGGGCVSWQQGGTVYCVKP